MSTDVNDFTVVHDKNPVGVLYRGYTLCDNNCGSLRKLLTEGFADAAVGSRINSTRGIVKNNDFRLFEKRSCNAQTLLLSA